MDALKELLEYLELGPVWVPVLLLLCGALSWFIVKYFEQRNALKRIEAGYRQAHTAKINDKLIAYASVQTPLLYKAHILLFEDDDQGSDHLLENIRAADAMIMEPFREYKQFLKEPLVSEMYKIHNLLEQMKTGYQPDAAHLDQFKAMKSDFLKQVRRIEDQISLLINK